jgi:hypothetical protein
MHMKLTDIYQVEAEIEYRFERGGDPRRAIPWAAELHQAQLDYSMVSAAVGRVCAGGRLYGYYQGRQPEQTIWIPPGQWGLVRLRLWIEDLRYRDDDYVALSIDDSSIDELVELVAPPRKRGRPPYDAEILIHLFQLQQQGLVYEGMTRPRVIQAIRTDIRLRHGGDESRVPSEQTVRDMLERFERSSSRE